MKYTHINILALMLAFCIACKGQSKTEPKKVSTSYVPNSSIRTVKQDGKGNMLLVSTEGIIRYDGKSFTNLTSKVSSTRFWDVLEDRKGNLWFASVGSGVYYYDGKSFQNYTTNEGLASNSVFKIYEDKAGIIWFGTGDGASRYDGKSFRNFKTNEMPPPVQADSVRSSKPSRDPATYWMVNQRNNTINTIIEDKTGKIWFGTWGDAHIYDGKTYTSVTKKYGRTFKKVRSIILDKKGNIWLGGGYGLWRYNGATFTYVASNFVDNIYQDRKGNIWTSSESNNGESWALSRYDGKSLSDKKPTVTEITSAANGLFGILEARDGSIWFGASDGVYRYDGTKIENILKVKKHLWDNLTR